MSDLRKSYQTKSPALLTLLIWAIGLLGFSVLVVGVLSLKQGAPLIGNVDKLGQQGDFFGGHLAAIVGTITLAIAIRTSFVQQQQAQKFFMRGYFLDAVGLIVEASRANDINEALRIVDYFGRLALSQDDDELFLILNTSLAGPVRKQLESPDAQIQNNYHFAVTALKRIGDIQKQMALKRKGIG
jgi:hypothetical protein